MKMPGSILLLGVVLVATPTHAGPDAQEKCLKGRFVAAGKYEACQRIASGKLFAGSNQDYQKAIDQCARVYRSAWGRLLKSAGGLGSSCQGPRFIDNGDGTVTDNLTWLVWEKKDTSCPGNHCVSDVAAWSISDIETGANGSVFTTFLSALNQSPGCFAGQCDWRLPTTEELQTILLAPYPCSTHPCVDPIFGPTAEDLHWTSSRFATAAPLYGWAVNFIDGSSFNPPSQLPFAVRAVRGGL